MYRKCLIIFMVFSYCSIYSAPISMNVSAESALLMNADTGQILYAKEPYNLHYPASVTKIATLLYALKMQKNLIDQMIIIQKDAIVAISSEAKAKGRYRDPAYWMEPNGCHVGLKKGEEISFRDLLYCMMLASANDAANSIALVNGSIPAYMDELNGYLKTIGCQTTNFLNPHGLHHPQHQTCAHDLCMMAKEGLKDPFFREIVSKVRYTRPKTNLQKAYALLNGNRLLRPGKHFYDKAIGIKTGFHSHAKHTFVGAAQCGNRTLILVFLKCADRTKMFDEAIQLFETAFNQPKVEQTYLKAGKQGFSRQFTFADNSLNTRLNEDVRLSFYPAEDPNPACLLYWDEPRFPIGEGQKVGEIHLIAAGEHKSDNKVLLKANLFADNAVDIKWPFRWIAEIRTFVGRYPFFASLLLIASLSAFGVCLAILIRVKK